MIYPDNLRFRTKEEDNEKKKAIKVDIRFSNTDRSWRGINNYTKQKRKVIDSLSNDIDI